MLTRLKYNFKDKNIKKTIIKIIENEKEIILNLLKNQNI